MIVLISENVVRSCKNASACDTQVGLLLLAGFVEEHLLSLVVV